MNEDKDAAIVRGLQEWKEREQKLRDYFTPSAMKSLEFMKLKLDHLRGLNRQQSGGERSLLLGVLRAEIKIMEKHLHPNWFARQAERVSMVAGRVLKAFASWAKPTLVDTEKSVLFKAPAVVREQAKKVEQPLRIDNVLRVVSKQEKKGLLLKKERKNDLLPKRKQHKSKSLSLH